jgi:hypothetical protein
MASNELALEISAQELVDPKTAASEAIEFDDLDTVLQPTLSSANEAAADFEAADIELELEAEDIDALLGSSGKLDV